jgi:hypothetical protein
MEGPTRRIFDGRQPRFVLAAFPDATKGYGGGQVGRHWQTLSDASGGHGRFTLKSQAVGVSATHQGTRVWPVECAARARAGVEGVHRWRCRPTTHILPSALGFTMCTNARKRAHLRSCALFCIPARKWAYMGAKTPNPGAKVHSREAGMEASRRRAAAPPIIRRESRSCRASSVGRAGKAGPGFCG